MMIFFLLDIPVYAFFPSPFFPPFQRAGCWHVVVGGGADGGDPGPRSPLIRNCCWHWAALNSSGAMERPDQVGPPCVLCTGVWGPSILQPGAGKGSGASRLMAFFFL